MNTTAPNSNFPLCVLGPTSSGSVRALRGFGGFLIVALLALGSLSAQDLPPAQNPGEVRSAFNKMSQELKTFSAGFRQTKEFSFMDRPLVSNGKLYFERPGNLRWEYTDPMEYLMLINGNSIRIKEEGEVKSYSTSSNPIFKAVKNIVVGCISGEILNDPAYRSELYASKELYQVKLIPKENKLKEYMKEINIFLEVGSKKLSHLILIDGSGDATRIEFSQQKVNQPLPTNVFTQF